MRGGSQRRAKFANQAARQTASASLCGDDWPYYVSWPSIEAVEDVCGIHNDCPPLLALGQQEGHEVCPAEHIQVHCDLIQKKHLGQGGSGVEHVERGAQEVVLQSEICPSQSTSAQPKAMLPP